MKQRRTITKGVEELGLGEGLVGVVLWLPESDVGLKGKGAHPLDRCRSSKRCSAGTNLTFHNSVANTLCQVGHRLCVPHLWIKVWGRGLRRGGIERGGRNELDGGEGNSMVVGSTQEPLI